MSSRLLISRRAILSFILLGSLLLTACSAPPTNQPRVFTIGIAQKSAALNGIIAAFKTGLAELGYVEGKNVVYQEAGLFKNPNDLDPAIQKMVASKVDMIFAPGTAAVMAKKDTNGTDIPVVFANTTNPVALGLVQSIANPGGNVTGAMLIPTSTSHVLEYLTQVAPKTKRVLVIYDPTGVAADYLPSSKEVAAQLGLELVVKEIHSDDDAVTAIKNLPTDIDAIYNVPDVFVGTHWPELIKASLDHKLPLVSYDITTVQAGALLAYGADVDSQGKQAARLASEILGGAKPSSLPVEAAEYQLSLNLKTEQAIGVTIPDDLLRQAKTIVR